MMVSPFLVIPAKAGTPLTLRRRENSGKPAFAGVTIKYDGLN
jgi:hypothetical protein